MTSHSDGCVSESGVLTALSKALWNYVNEEGNSEYEETIIDEVYVVGSACTPDFEPNESDLDLCVTVLNPAYSGVQQGFDVYLREDCESRILDMADIPATGVDIGVYDSTDYIEDNEAYACRKGEYVEIPGQ